MEKTVKINFDTYYDKVKACWLGKNIGGTMGAPYEGTREILDIQGFVTKPGEVLPNDDLDLQLVWLYALERTGPKGINAQNLGEYWNGLITPHWNEYGIGKNNIRRGLIPPLSGDYENHWKHSNGAWIRTEIWACVAPGTPVIAAKYALEDAVVDHGAGEGTYAAAFVASMQAAAFILSDIRQCIEIGLASIPESSRMAQSIRFLIKCHDEGMAAMDARNAIQALNADIGNGWFEAPSNVSYAVLGMLYGAGDFKKSMITAINCGDDTDCTAGTVGATLGILYGTAGLPEDWIEYLGDDIITKCIAKGNVGNQVPDTCTELTRRVANIAPTVLYENRSFPYASEFIKRDVELVWNEESSVPEDTFDELMKSAEITCRYIEELAPYTMVFENVLFRTTVTLDKAPDVEPDSEIGVKIIFTNLHLENEPYNLSLRWILPEGFHMVKGKKAIVLDAISAHTEGHLQKTETHAVIRAGETVEAENRLVLEIVAKGRSIVQYVPILLLG